MSIKIMSKVWEQSSHEGSPLLLLLALADHASDDGVCWPGIPRLAHKTRKTERHTKRLLTKLENSGEVYIAREVGRGNTNMYYITLGFDEEEMVHTLIKRFEFGAAKATEIAKQVILLQEKGDTQDTISDEGEDGKGDIQGQEKVTPGAEKVTPGAGKDDIAMSPESSSTVLEPSEGKRQKEDSVFPEKTDSPSPASPRGGAAIPEQEGGDSDDEDSSVDNPHGRGSRGDGLDIGGARLVEAAGNGGAFPDGRGNGVGAGVADPVVEAIIEQTETHPNQFDLGRNTVAEREKAGGAWTAPPPAGGDDGLAAAAIACLWGDGPKRGSGTYHEMVEILSRVHADWGLHDMEMGEALAVVEDAAELFKKEKPSMAVYKYPSFAANYGNYLSQAKAQTAGVPARRARYDTANVRASQAAFEKRKASKPPPVKDDKWGKAIKGEIQLQMTKPTFEIYVGRTSFTCNDGVLTVAAPDETVKGWLENRLATTIRRTAVGVVGPVEVRFEAGGPLAAAPEEGRG